MDPQRVAQTGGTRILTRGAFLQKGLWRWYFNTLGLRKLCFLLAFVVKMEVCKTCVWWVSEKESQSPVWPVPDIGWCCYFYLTVDVWRKTLNVRIVTENNTVISFSSLVKATISVRPALPVWMTVVTPPPPHTLAFLHSTSHSPTHWCTHLSYLLVILCLLLLEETFTKAGSPVLFTAAFLVP